MKSPMVAQVLRFGKSCEHMKRFLRERRDDWGGKGKKVIKKGLRELIGKPGKNSGEKRHYIK